MLFQTIETKLSEQEAFKLFFEAWIFLFKEIPTLNSLCVLLAQTALETGRFQSMKNWNFGNIKRTKDHDHCLYECGEFINGRFKMYYPPDPVCEFNSYLTAKDGIVEYISFLAKRERYVSAWSALVKGDPVQYCKELKEKGPYFTAPLEKYTEVLVKLFNEFQARFKTMFETKKKEITDLSSLKEEIENNFIKLLFRFISSNVKYEIEYPQYNSGVVWIKLDFNDKHILVEWQKDVGYGIHYDDLGGFPVIERCDKIITSIAVIKEIFES